jgi:hypothetical protein
VNAHTCTAACWAEALRLGLAPECDPWAARAAADREAAEAQAEDMRRRFGGRIVDVRGRAFRMVRGMRVIVDAGGLT